MHIKTQVEQPFVSILLISLYGSLAQTHRLLLLLSIGEPGSLCSLFPCYEVLPFQHFSASSEAQLHQLAGHFFILKE